MKRTSYFRVYMPYLFQKLEHTKYSYVYLPLNRYYKPLGYSASAFVKYEDYLNHALVFKTDISEIDGVWHDPADGGLYFYNDNPSSTDDYMKRLERLLERDHSGMGRMDSALGRYPMVKVHAT